VIASPEAAAFIRQRGGRLFVRVHRHRCCGALTLLDASTAPWPVGEYLRLPADGFVILLAPSRRPLPGEIHIARRGLLRRRIEAYWNGCAYVMHEQARDA
jgi:hypothetical protein